MNEQSSRSHFVFTLRISGVNEITEQHVQGILNLIDLAGSEHLNKSGAIGDRLKETQAISKSLSALSDVLFSIAKEDHVPYRNSKLTYLSQTTCIAELKRKLSSTFVMKDLRATKAILGMHIRRDKCSKLLWLSQERDIRKVLHRFNMDKTKKMNTPVAAYFRLTVDQCPSIPEEKEEMQKVPYASIIDSLMYVIVYTRPNIAHVIDTMSRFLSNLGREYWNDVKWILMYLQRTSNLTLKFGYNKLEFLCYNTNVDMTRDLDSRRSTTRYLILFARGAISWQSRLHKCSALSTMEAEFIAQSLRQEKSFFR